MVKVTESIAGSFTQVETKPWNLQSTSLSGGYSPQSL
jgi:hypothetical protein